MMRLEICSLLFLFSTFCNALKILTTDFDLCTVHLLRRMAESNYTYFTESFLVENQGPNPWTIRSATKTTIPILKLQTTKKTTCTVNIIVAESCHRYDYIETFLPNQDRATALFINIVAPHMSCGYKFKKISMIRAPYLLLVLDNRTDSFAYSFVEALVTSVTTTPTNSSVALRVKVNNNVNLKTLLKSWHVWNDHFHGKTLYVINPHTNARVDSEDGRHYMLDKCPYHAKYSFEERLIINCYAGMVFVYEMQQILNYTIEYGTTPQGKSNELVTPERYVGSVFVNLDSNGISRVTLLKLNTSIVTYFPSQLLPYLFAYCVKSLERPSFDLKFYFSIFDPVSTLVILAGICLNAYLTTRLGRTLRISKILILLVLLFFFVCSWYESYFASDVIVPPPPAEPKSVRELLLDWGYKFPLEGKADRKVYMIEGLTEKEVYASSYNSSFSYKGNLYGMLVKCKDTKFGDERGVLRRQYFKVGNVYCNRLKAKNLKHGKVYMFFKPGGFKLYPFGLRYHEAGLLLAIDNFRDFVMDLIPAKKNALEQWESNQPKKFKLGGWRISPIFALFGVACSLCICEFIFEGIFRKCFVYIVK